MEQSKIFYPDALSIQEQIQVSLDNFGCCFWARWNTQLESVFLEFIFNKYNSVHLMTIKVSLEQYGYGVSVSHPIVYNIAHTVKDRISYERLQFDLIPDTRLVSETMFDVNMFLHLKNETKQAHQSNGNEQKNY